MKLILSVAAALTVAGLSLGDVRREGSGERRKSLDAMELRPFPSDLWASLSGWTQGAALTEADTAGSVVVIVTWADWYPASMRALATTQQVASRHADKGLVVVGVHHPEGWEGAPKAAADKGVSFRLAHDASGTFRSALHVDQDPDIYVIDRSGQLRYADIETASLEEAVSTLLAESREDAAATKARLEREAREAREATLRSENIAQDVRMRTIPSAVELGYAQPGPEAYVSERWPKIDQAVKQFLNIAARPGEVEPVYKVVMPRNATWAPREPSFEGRILIVYPWHPEIRLSWSIVAEMDRLQRALGRDAVVVGALFPRDRLQGAPQGFSQEKTDEERRKELKVLNDAFSGFAKNRDLDHTVVADLEGAFLATFHDRRDILIPVPGAMVFSSDGTLRWYGWTEMPGFKSSIDRLLEIDPGIKLRRQLEANYLEGQR